jgi:flagella basal body P-ring formation protein FlgA
MIALGLAGAACAQDSVRLKHLALVDPETPVTLGMIAELEGEKAAALADVVVIESPRTELGAGQRQSSVDIDRVRSVLRETGRVDWSRLVLRGSSCTLRPDGMPAPRVERDGVPHRVLPVLASTIRTTTIKGHVAMAIAQALGVEPEDLRLTFDPRDARVLATSALGRTVDAAASGISKDVPVRVTVYEGDRIVLSESVRVGASVRRDVCVLTTTRRRSETIGSEDFAMERRWLDPTQEPIGADEAIGLAPRTAIRAGEPLLAADAELPLVVKRGDLVSVHCLSGSIVLQVPARAMSDGRDGEVIEFKHLRSEGVFRARMSGRGRAVAVPAGLADSTKEPPR